MSNNQILSTVNAVAYSQASGNPIAGAVGQYGTYNAAAQYAKNALPGTTVRPPSNVVVGLSTNKQGDPVISSGLQSQYNALVAASRPKPPPLTPALTAGQMIRNASSNSRVSTSQPVKA